MVATMGLSWKPSISLITVCWFGFNKTGLRPVNGILNGLSNMRPQQGMWTENETVELIPTALHLFRHSTDKRIPLGRLMAKDELSGDSPSELQNTFFEKYGWLNCWWFPPGELWICKNMNKHGMESQKPEEVNSPRVAYQMKWMIKLEEEHLMSQQDEEEGKEIAIRSVTYSQISFWKL